MARNAEKAQAMLNRMVTARKEQEKGPKEKRPHLASEVDDLGECEKWRREVVKQISKKVTEIQNGSLGEHKIRDLNDFINKLLREKKHWERQIKFLGGPDYMKQAGPMITDSDGKSAFGVDGYYYFGAARELPGVRELFEKVVPEPKRRTRGEMYTLIDADYYGYRDDDDGKLKALELEAEKKLRDQAEKEWLSTQRANKRRRYEALGMEVKDDSDDEEIRIEKEGEVLKGHVPLPDEQHIKKLILEQRKKALLERLAVEQEIRNEAAAAAKTDAETA
eukprot:gb/GEZN01011664.1/.p1 GENE.gb/GEZN01011664.1/~~gb/GEZN01011664.1/.p1  ORF type:complete len:278 (-),score=64.24 gb/GEZN01011664.1/:206-1039(-)